MLIILGLTLFVICFLILLGGPISLLIINKLKLDNSATFITFIAFSLIIGFGISALIASWSYGTFGINTYPKLTILAAFIMWLLILLKLKQDTFSNLKIKIADFLIFAPIIFSIYLTKTQWSGLFKPRIYSGKGPDVIQNLMAAQSTTSIGETWGQSAKNLQQILSASNMQQVGQELFRVPNFNQVAGFDYLVFGGRWGLTVPASQILRFFGPQAILWEIGLVLLSSLICLSIITYSISKIITNSGVLASVISLITISNAALLNQYFNGGLSQIFGLIGVYGILVVLILIIKNSAYHTDQKSGFNFNFFLIAFFSWVGSSVTYVDQTFVVILLLFVLVFIFSIFNRLVAKNIFENIILAGFLAVVVNPLFTKVIISDIRSRISANSGTGTTSGFWKPPSQFWGIFDVFSAPDGRQSQIALVISIVFSILIIIFFVFNLFKKGNLQYLSIIGVSAYIVTVIGFLISINSNGRSDYIYSKVALYMFPFTIIPLMLILSLSKSQKMLKKSIIYLMVTINIGSVVSSEYNFTKNPEAIIIPSEFSEFLKNNEIKQYLLEHNYLMPYKPSYNFAGLFGAEYWISKAPNDMILDSRMSKELRLLCFIGDSGCNPTTEPIKNDFLQRYGILEYRSKLTTKEFSMLSISERYNYNFDAFGMPRQLVPEKFMGGNPYFK